MLLTCGNCGKYCGLQRADKSWILKSEVKASEHLTRIFLIGLVQKDLELVETEIQEVFAVLKLPLEISKLNVKKSGLSKLSLGNLPADIDAVIIVHRCDGICCLPGRVLLVGENGLYTSLVEQAFKRWNTGPHLSFILRLEEGTLSKNCETNKPECRLSDKESPGAKNSPIPEERGDGESKVIERTDGEVFSTSTVSREFIEELATAGGQPLLRELASHSLLICVDGSPLSADQQLAILRLVDRLTQFMQAVLAHRSSFCLCKILRLQS